MQGLGAAALVPAALSLIGSMYPPGRARTRALSLLGAMASVGIMTGLVLGGMITDLLGWRWVFLLMTVPALGSAVAAPRLLPEARARQSGRPDVAGALLLCVGLMSVLFGLTRVERDGPLAVRTIAPLLAGALLLAAFVAWQLRSREPLMRLAILRIRSLRVASLGIGVNALAFMSIVYVGTLYLQNALGFSAMRAGVCPASR